MILLQASQIARHFSGEVLFEQIQMEIQEKSRIALVGRNGAGKSTLLKIIAGIEEPDVGGIAKSRGIRIGYLAQNTGLTTSKTIYKEMLDAFSEVLQIEKRMHELEAQISDPAIHEHAQIYERTLTEYDRLQQEYQEKNGYGYEAEIRSVLAGFRFDESYYQQEISTLSGGQKTRLALAKLLLEKPDLLILDEPTNHLDIDTLAWLENYLQNYPGALLIVSHDRYFLDKVVSEVYELSRHVMHYYKGNYTKYLVLKEERVAQDWKAYEKQQAEIAKLEEFVQKNIVRATTTKRAQSRRKRLEKMTRIDRPKGDEKSANFLFHIGKASGNQVLYLQNGAIGYATEILCEPIELDIRKQEAIALVGPNGIGKSTLLKSIMEEIPFIHGEIRLGANVSIGYYDQEQAILHSKKTVLQELWDEHSTVPEKDIRSVLGSFLFSGEDVEKSVPMLSGGEKARLALAKLAMKQENFLILDEPTNHLDIDSKEVLEDALIDYEGTLFFVSHDRYFINRIATKVVELSEQGSKLYLGDYDYYVEKKLEEKELIELANQEQVLEVKKDSAGKMTFQESKEKQKQVRTLQRKVAELEQQLADVELKIVHIQEEMNQPGMFEDHQALQQLNATLTVQKVRQEELLEEWEQQSVRLEEVDK